MKYLEMTVNGVDYAITTNGDMRGGGSYHTSVKAPGSQGTSARRLRRFLAKQQRNRGSL